MLTHSFNGTLLDPRSRITDYTQSLLSCGLQCSGRAGQANMHLQYHSVKGLCWGELGVSWEHLRGEPNSAHSQGWFAQKVLKLSPQVWAITSWEVRYGEAGEKTRQIGCQFEKKWKRVGMEEMGKVGNKAREVKNFDVLLKTLEYKSYWRLLSRQVIWSNFCLEGRVSWVIEDVLEVVKSGGWEHRCGSTAIVQAGDDVV